MDKSSKDWQDEQIYLQNTENAIDTKVNSILQHVNERRDIVEELKSQFFHEKYTHEMDNGDQASMYQRIDDFMLFANEQIDLATLLQRRKMQPYFGRVDFVQNNDRMPIYIGLSTIDDDKNYYVFDWRAPVGELFYNFGKGPAQYDSPQGVMSGQITLKRQYDIANGDLQDIYDVDQNIFDEYIQKILRHIHTQQLHNIASTIQREQNEIIRDTLHDVIVVQGCVGSGKTTVALHRIAYMLYKFPNLKSDNILLFSPNELFFSHVSGVLPELGEDNTRTAFFAYFVQRLLKLTTRVENMDEFVARYDSAQDDARQQILAKLDESMYQNIISWVRTYVDHIGFTRGFKLRKHVYSVGKLNKFLHEDTKDLRLLDKTDTLHAQIMKECKLNEMYSDKMYEEIVSRLSSTIDIQEMFNLFLSDSNLRTCNFDTVINFEDAVLLCLFYEALKELNVNMDIKQVVFDEAQEYPMLFIAFVMRMFPHAQFSFYGDDDQRTTAGAVHKLADILSLDAGYRSTHYYVLNHTYRSSEEIVEYSNKILGRDLHNAFRLKYGQPVEEIQSSNISKQIDDILDVLIKQNRSVGIICGDNKQALNIFDNLDPKYKVLTDIIINAKTTSLKQIQVLPITMAKGLEFDTAIVLPNGGVFNQEFGKQQEYIACTRAINKLYVIKEDKNEH